MKLSSKFKNWYDCCRSGAVEATVVWLPFADAIMKLLDKVKNLFGT